MKVSTKGRYGLRAIIDLAVYGGSEHVSLYSIAERQHISSSYLEQVFSTLRKSGLVTSVKGAQGGYRLSKDPSQITAKDVLTILEGELTVVDVSDGESGDFVKEAIDTLVWERLNGNLDSLFKRVTIEELANDFKSKHGMMPLMYFI